MKKLVFLLLGIIILSCGGPIYKMYVPADEFVKDKGYEYLSIDTMGTGGREIFLYIRYRYKEENNYD